MNPVKTMSRRLVSFNNHGFNKTVCSELGHLRKLASGVLKQNSVWGLTFGFNLSAFASL